MALPLRGYISYFLEELLAVIYRDLENLLMMICCWCWYRQLSGGVQYVLL